MWRIEEVDTKRSRLRMRAVISLAAILLFLTPAISISADASNTTNSSVPTAIATSCQTAVANLYNSMSKSTAVTNAVASQDYQAASAGYRNVTYSSIFQIAKTEAPYPACTEKLLSYDVAFTLQNSSGGWAGYLVITENQNLVVIGESIQTAYGMALTSTKWSGYEVQTSSSSPANVYESSSYFTQATPSYPTGGCADSGACVMATWVGLTDQSKGDPDGLAQDGTIATCKNSGCTPSYFAWYEMLPSGIMKCTASNGGAVSISGGDTMFASTTNEAQFGGSNSKYDFYIDDSTSATSCYLGGQSYTFLTAPTYGEFIVENPRYCNGASSCTCYTPPSAGTGCDSLDKFNTVPFSTAFIESGSNYGYINSYSTAAITMQNQNDNGNFGGCTGNAITNVSPGSITGNGDFTMTYNSSQYTPEYNTGC